MHQHTLRFIRSHFEVFSKDCFGLALSMPKLCVNCAKILDESDQNVRWNREKKKQDRFRTCFNTCGTGSPNLWGGDFLTTAIDFLSLPFNCCCMGSFFPLLIILNYIWPFSITLHFKPVIKYIHCYSLQLFSHLQCYSQSEPEAPKVHKLAYSAYSHS